MARIVAQEIIKKAFLQGKNLEECRQELIREAERKGLPRPDDQMVMELFGEVEEYNRYIISERKKTTARPEFETTHIWREFNNPDLETEMPHWFRYEKSLKENDWPNEDIQSVQESSTDIMDAILEAEKKKWNHSKGNPVKGLILGHVQSGKTASMAGVMALAADSGYDMVIVLSGIHNALNYQTARRFEKDLWTYTRHGQNFRPRPQAQDYVQSLRYRRSSWCNITVETDLIRYGQHPFVDLAKPLFGVFKKNVTVLKKLSEWIQSNGQFFGEDFKLLIIDDECDQASPNTADYQEGEESATNSELRNLIYNEYFPKVTYIGYTATPFATILNQPPGERSLYPEDFIHTLRKPVRHFGTREVFGEVSESEIPMAVIMNPESEDDEEEYWQTELRRAVAYFICASASRNHVRNQNKYTTMLVHTSSRILEHRHWSRVIAYIINTYKDNQALLKEDCRKVWEEQRNRLLPQKLSEIFGLDDNEFTVTEQFGEIADKLSLVLTGTDGFGPLKVCVDNSQPGDFERLSYPDLSEEDIKPYPIIVVGGNTLSRGLTLEGLTVSFFLREVSQMDSLLQMGRWFGYRRGYEDLVRVWTTGTTLEYFHHIGSVEIDLREQIETLYTNSGVSPDEVALSVKTHPSMRVVRSNAMQAATDGAVYFGSAPQTYYFRHKDSDWLINNWNAANELLGRLYFDKPKYAKATVQDILDFLYKVRVHEHHASAMGPKYLSEFIEKANENGHLANWNVAVAARLSGKNNDPGHLESYQLLLRTRLELESQIYPDDANIKSLRAPGDLFIDLEPDKSLPEEEKLSATNSPAARADLMKKRELKPEDRPGLILLYPIKKNAEPHENIKKGRADLDAVHDVLGWSIVFPQAASDNMRDLYDRVAINFKQ